MSDAAQASPGIWFPVMAVVIGPGFFTNFMANILIFPAVGALAGAVVVEPQIGSNLLAAWTRIAGRKTGTASINH